jgi:hypothetical protein
MAYVWYVGYGSNLHEQRFFCYIKGGTPHFGKTLYDGCTDKRLPAENKAMIINYPLYFALPDKKTGTSNWGAGGVAFIGLKKDRRVKTLCRMWKITNNQYNEVKWQEGSWYGKEILLGDEDGIPIYTITNGTVLTNINKPSDTYIKTIALGLKETYSFTDKKVVRYLITKRGIKDSIRKDNILRIVTSQ